VTIAAELLPGTLVDRRYRIQRVLGRGGFGRTYLVVDKWRFGELCVLKEFAPSNRGDAVVTQKLRELFQREATILHKLNHPQIPKFFAVFEENSRLFIVQEYINGKTYWNLLREKHQSGSTFTEPEIVQWLKDLLRVLGYLHKQNIVHRDISPDNVMLARGKKLPILIDFGAVKQAANHFQTHAVGSDGLIQASVSVGKSGYAPYEQLRMGQCSPRSDLYALAVTAVVLLTAKPPSQLIDPGSLEWKWQSLVKLDPLLVKILERMMAEKPQERYPAAEAVLKDLQKLNGALSSAVTAAPAAVTALDKPEATTTLQFKRLGALFPHMQAQTTRLQPSEVKLLRRGRLLNLPKPKLLVGTSTEKLSLTWQKLVLGGCLALLPLGGVALGVQSSYITAICSTLNNCAADRHAEALYAQAVQQATSAQTLSDMAKNLPDLKLARQQLSASVADLSGLIGNAKLAPVVRQVLPTYISRLDRLDNRLEKEGQAIALLSRAKAEAVKADEMTKLAAKNQDFGAAKQQWSRVLAMLQAIQGSTFAQSQVAARSQEYSARLEAVGLQMANISPPEPIAANQTNPFSSVAMAPSAPSVNVTVVTPTPAAPASVPQRSAPVATARPRTTAIASTPARLAVPRATVIRPQTTAIASAPPPVAPRSAALSERSQRVAAPSRSAPRPVAQPVETATRTGYASAPTSPGQPPIQIASRPPEPEPITVAPPSDAEDALVAQQTLNNVSIQLDSARVSPDGTMAANLVVENKSDRTFGFVPVFAEVEDADGNKVLSRIQFTGADGIAEPGEVIHGQIRVFNRQWNQSGSQNLALVIQEGTTGSRNFRLTF
jgi:tRNA A-37 threonylcarbamoyl transferase component Bud32